LDEILSVAGHLQALVNGNKRQSLAAGKINFALNQLIHGTCMDIVVKHNGSVALENALGLILKDGFQAFRLVPIPTFCDVSLVVKNVPSTFHMTMSYPLSVNQLREKELKSP
jgi:hypothetical protein